MRSNKSILARLHGDWHFLLLIIFFITHGYAEHTGMIPVGDLLLLLAVLLVAGLGLFWISKIIFKDRRKAALFVTFFLALFLFFGAFQDFFGKIQAHCSTGNAKNFFSAFACWHTRRIHLSQKNFL